MADSGDDDDLASFLESEILSATPPQDEASPSERPAKRPRVAGGGPADKSLPRLIDSGIFSKIPPELFHRIFKFLSPEDLIACSLVCRFMNFAASDECLWRRLYCMRWGLASPAGKLRECSWKKLYIEANDDQVILDRTVADQVSSWKSGRGLTDEAVIGHVCSGNTCSYTQIGDVFLCEKTGRVHVCDETCREVVLDQHNGLLLCTISGHCFDRWLSPEEESDTEQQQAAATGEFARAIFLGYRCEDEEELEATLRFC